jgi:hypothetical protein
LRTDDKQQRGSARSIRRAAGDTMKKTFLALLAVLMLPASGMAAQPKHFVDTSKLPFAEIPGVPSQRLWGKLGGAGYRIEVPENWNGKLVMWAHGYRGTGLELTVDNHPLRAFLVANGYAWAASSFTKNGYDPAQGVTDTNALRGLFVTRFGEPDRTYITGASLGGHIAAVIAEHPGSQYDGAAAVCGNLADYEQFDYYLDFNAAAQTLSGVGQTYPYAADYLTSQVPATKAALGPAFPFVLNSQGNAFKSLVELRSGGVRPVFEQGWLYWNGVVPGDFVFGAGTMPVQLGIAVQNANVVYQFDSDPVLSAAESSFNTLVQRVTATTTSRRKLPITSGALKVPMLTLHTLGDLYVPFRTEVVYAQRVAQKGKSDLLVQRATRDVGHCTFTPVELTTAFLDLVDWVEAGVKPAGDNVANPAAVADPDFGCTFTDATTPRLWDTVPALAFLEPSACPVP